MKHRSLVDPTSGQAFLFPGEDKHQPDRPADVVADHESSQLRPSTSPSILPFPATRNFTPNEVSMLPPTDYVFRSGVARCTLAGLAARTTRSLLLQTCSVEGVERQWPGGGESCWWRYRERPGSNDVCLALEERPLAGLEDTGFGTKMMAKG